MRALISRFAGGPDSLQFEELPDPVPGQGEVLIRVSACGLNYPDALMIEDKYQVKAPRPFSPGAEFSGVVEALGPASTRFKVGERVIARAGWGGLAELVAVTEERCVRIPDEMPFEDAAAFIFTYATAYHALVDRARLQPGETVLVLGAAGGVGVATIEVAKALDARVVAAVSSEQKAELARSKGADACVIYPKSFDAVKSLTSSFRSELGGDGADVVVDPVGGHYSEAALRSTAEHSRYLVLGFTAGIPRLPMNLPLLKSSEIIGVNWRTFLLTEPEANERNVRALFALYREGKVKPAVTQIFAFRDAAEAIGELSSRSAMGKLVVCVQLRDGP